MGTEAPIAVTRSGEYDVCRRRALRALLGVVTDLGAFCEGLVALALNRRMMYEQVLARLIGCDEPKALVVAKPLNGSCGHGSPSFVHVHCVTRRALVNSGLAKRGHCGNSQADAQPKPTIAETVATDARATAEPGASVQPSRRPVVCPARPRRRRLPCAAEVLRCQQEHFRSGAALIDQPVLSTSPLLREGVGCSASRGSRLDAAATDGV